MNRFSMRIAIATIFVSLLAAGQLVAQETNRGKGTMGGGWGQRVAYVRMFDPDSVTTVTGAVLSIDKFTPAKGMSYGMHVMLKTDKETLPVHLGPAWYIENQELQIAPGDEIEVKGSRITFEGKPALIAAQVAKGDEVLTLRDERGFPAWSGWRRRQ